MRWIVSAAVAVVLLGCGGGTAVAPAPAVYVSPKTLALPANGASFLLKSTVTGTRWTVDGAGTSVVTVDTYGLVMSEGVAAGPVARIIGTHPGDARSTDYCDVTIIPGVGMGHDATSVPNLAQIWVDGLPVPGALFTTEWTVWDSSGVATYKYSNVMRIDVPTQPGRTYMVTLLVRLDNGVQIPSLAYRF